MFEAKLKSRNQPKLGALAVTFPIPEERYENVILALQHLQIGDAGKQDCCIDSIRAPDCPALCRMSGTLANVDELDWLGKQLESFDRYELLQFSAAAERFALCSADELIDLSFCANEMTVISDFSDLERVGRKHYLTVHGACDSEELENLDGKETALALISGQPGYVTRYGVVYDNGIKLEQAYDRKHLPPIWMAENCILELKLRATGKDDPKKQEWVQLPASRMKLERAMLRVGIASCGEMQMLVTDSRFPDEVNCTLDFERETLLEKVMKTRTPATSLWQKRESILLFTGTGATVLLASHMSVEDILFTIRDLADVQQVLVDQLREQCGCCDKEGEKDKPLQRVEEEALQREPQDIVEYLREQGVCLRQLARKLEQNETIFL